MDIKNRLLVVLKEHSVAAGLGVLGIAAIGYGVFGLNTPVKPETDMVFEAEQETSDNSAKKGKEITVDISGGVVKPGVYDLPVESRVQDAVMAAGGMRDDADQERVSKEINLAASLTDGAKLYIPVIGETGSVNVSKGEGSETVLESTNTLININSANETELDTLPGVGPATAQKIIDNRPYQTIEELLEKKAVGQSIFDKIKDQISTY